MFLLYRIQYFKIISVYYFIINFFRSWLINEDILISTVLVPNKYSSSSFKSTLSVKSLLIRKIRGLRLLFVLFAYALILVSFESKSEMVLLSINSLYEKSFKSEEKLKVYLSRDSSLLIVAMASKSD